MTLFGGGGGGGSKSVRKIIQKLLTPSFFNFKLVRLSVTKVMRGLRERPSLDLKTRSRVNGKAEKLLLFFFLALAPRHLQ
jgi:hypothetical protein